MCAIAGAIGATACRRETLERQLAAMRHRGPDDTAMYFDEAASVALGHNRLAILDPTPGGRQPMVSDVTGDVLSFNGEIYNHRELRSELETHGWLFRSRSDTEVLLHAFGQWGLAALDRIEGMFAFALWRPRERSLYLVRDPMGVKPLYWVVENGQASFASELGGLIAGGSGSPRIDRRAISQFLEFGYTFEAERTCLEGVRKLPPGHYLRLTADRPDSSPVRYWRPDLTPRPEREANLIVEELHDTLRLVVRQHLIADAPIGLLLSGGVDSSLLAALAAEERPLRTLTMAFADSPLDERAQARRVAQLLNTEHEELTITPADVERGVGESARHFDDLFADWGLVSTRLAYAKARERGVKVVIVGEGADELFGGYDVFRRTHRVNPRRIWLWRLYRAYAGRRFGGEFGVFKQAMERGLAEAGGDRFAAIRLFETRHQLPNNYVQKVDKAAMSVSVEARTPYLDRRVASLAYRMPRSALLSGSSEKLALRRVAERYRLLPPDVVWRPKLGGAIGVSWMDDAPRFRAFARERLLDGDWTRELGLAGAMRAYLVEGRAGFAFPHAISIFRNLAWRLLILELWAEARGVRPHAA